MKKIFYPAVSQSEENSAFSVSFQDVDGCVTCGDNQEDAYEMAFDALGLTLSYMADNKEPIPLSS